MSFVVQNNFHNRHSYGANQKPYYLPHPTNRPPNSPNNLTIAVPPQKAIPTLNHVQPTNLSPARPVQNQHPDRLMQMGSDLRKVKKQLNDITTESDKKKQSMYEQRRNNRSSDNIYAPHQRVGPSNGDRVQGMNVSKKNINRISQTVSLECFPPQLPSQPKQLQINYQTELNKLKVEIENLHHENEFYRNDIQDKQLQITQLAKKLKQTQDQKQETEQTETLWKNKILQLEEEIVKHKTTKKNNFDHVLKDQLQEISSFKQIIEAKNQQIKHLNERILLNKRQTENAMNDANVEKIKHLSEIKQEKQKSQIQLLNKDNEIKSLRNTLSNLESKLSVAIQDNKSKDEFIKNHLVGRMKLGEEQQYVKDILEKYQINFPVNALLEKLLEQEKQIQLLKQQLHQ